MTQAISDINKVEHVFNFIRQHGTFQKQGTTIGSFWTVEVWIHPDFPDLRAKLMDEGASKGLSNTQLDCCTTYGRAVQYYRGDASVVDALHEQVLSCS